MKSLFNKIRTSFFNSRRSKIAIVFCFYCVVIIGLFYGNFVSASTPISDIVIFEDVTWTVSGSPYVIEESSGVIIDYGVTLTIEPGVVVKFGEGSGIGVYGKINAVGTGTQKIYLTSIYDDSVGGDSNYDGDDTFPTEFDDWVINFVAGGESKFENVVFRYSYGGLFMYRTPLVLKNTEFGSSTRAIGIAESELNLEDVYIHDIINDAVWGNASDVEIKSSQIKGVLFGDALSFSGGSKILLDNIEVSEIGLGTALGLYSSDATTTKTVFEGGLYTGIELYASTVPSSIYMEDSSVNGFVNTGILNFSSRMRVVNSRIVENLNGFRVYGTRTLASTYINGSAIAGNLIYGIENKGTAVVEARNNWWGDASGPFHSLANPIGLGDEVSDRVDFSLWLDHDPTETAECCSSVVFIPGFQASRLYRQQTFENQLWPPNRDADGEKLMLDENGKSLLSGIYTRDIVDEVYFFNIYKN